MALKSIIINSNPETVSTDFDTSDKLYFEPLTRECVLDIIEREKPEGVIVQFGGQTAINLAAPLAKVGVHILGTSVDGIDRAENRDRFLKTLEKLSIPVPPGATAFSLEDAKIIAQRIGFPVLVRPSYVLGGRAMEIVYNVQELTEYMTAAAKVSPEHPVLIDKYLIGKEVETDGICDGNEALIVGVMEHIERAGVHSGDSFAVYPAQTLEAQTKKTIVDYAVRIGIELGIKGLYNIQFVVEADGKVYALEVNPRKPHRAYTLKSHGSPHGRRCHAHHDGRYAAQPCYRHRAAQGKPHDHSQGACVFVFKNDYGGYLFRPRDEINGRSDGHGLYVLSGAEKSLCRFGCASSARRSADPFLHHRQRQG